MTMLIMMEVMVIMTMMIFFMQHRQRHNLLILFCSTRIVDSWLFKDQNSWFYSNRESTFWTTHDILEKTFPFCWSETTKWVTESTKWEYISTKWATETAKGVTETTKWESKKQQSGQQILYRILKSWKSLRLLWNPRLWWCPRSKKCLTLWWWWWDREWKRRTMKMQ